MNELQIFSNETFGQVRTVEKEGEPWFVAADVCRALGIVNSRDAVKRIDDEEKGVISTDTLGGQQEMTVVNEPGLYALVLGSRKPEARTFKRWITHEVIPSIRKHGLYARDELLDNPDLLISVATELKREREERRRIEAETAAILPKAQYYDMLADRNLLTSLRDTARMLKVQERIFTDVLQKKKYLYRDTRAKLVPYAEKNKGYFAIKEYVNEKTGHTGIQTLVTMKGREHLISVFTGEAV